MLYTLIHHQNANPGPVNSGLSDGLLTPEETAVFHNLKTEKRRWDWLNGRYAAKQLLQRVFQKEMGLNLAYTEFMVLRKENGAPAVSWLNGNGRPPVTLSISHAGGLAFCAVRLQADEYLGCDIEQIAPRSALFVADYFTSAEQALVSQSPTAYQDGLVNAIWSGKEAALKALELGLRVDTRAVTCLPEFGREGCWQPLGITLDSGRLPAPAPALTGRWQVAGPFVFTVVAPAAVLAEEVIRELEIKTDD